MLPRRKRAIGIALAMTSLIALGLVIPRGDQEQESTFRTATEAKELITSATRLAAKKHRRVLVVWGSDARERDQDLCQTLRRGTMEAWPFSYDYVITPVEQSDGTAALAQSLGVPAGAEGAVLSILDARGRPIAHHVASEFRGREGWDTASLGALLTQYAVEPEDAEILLKSALADAAKTNRRLLVHLGAPW